MTGLSDMGEQFSPWIAGVEGLESSYLVHLSTRFYNFLRSSRRVLLKKVGEFMIITFTRSVGWWRGLAKSVTCLDSNESPFLHGLDRVKMAQSCWIIQLPD